MTLLSLAFVPVKTESLTLPTSSIPTYPASAVEGTRREEPSTLSPHPTPERLKPLNTQTHSPRIYLQYVFFSEENDVNLASV
jgi:hypothetical protein